MAGDVVLSVTPPPSALKMEVVISTTAVVVIFVTYGTRLKVRPSQEKKSAMFSMNMADALWLCLWVT